MDLADLDLATASERIGDEFRLDLEDGDVITFELVEATQPATAPSGGGSGTTFSIVFRGPHEPVLNQGILPLQNDVWGMCHMFVVPVDRDDVGTYYEAVFSRAT